MVQLFFEPYRVDMIACLSVLVQRQESNGEIFIWGEEASSNEPCHAKNDDRPTVVSDTHTPGHTTIVTSVYGIQGLVTPRPRSTRARSVSSSSQPSYVVDHSPINPFFRVWDQDLPNHPVDTTHPHRGKAPRILF